MKNGFRSDDSEWSDSEGEVEKTNFTVLEDSDDDRRSVILKLFIFSIRLINLKLKMKKN